MSHPVMIVLSGGQDSTTCAYWAKHRLVGVGDVHAVTFDYGQLHRVEIEAAVSCADAIGCATHEIVQVGPILKGTSPLINPDSELAQYRDHGSLPGGLEDTFVPGRNALFLTLAANRAYCLGLTNIVAGLCQEDYGGYPDCRQAFVDAFMHGLKLAHDRDFKLHTPLMDLTKAQSVKLAMELPGCYHQLAHSHTSYDGAFPPVGKDHATLLRAKGFEEAGVPDPLVVRAWTERVMGLPGTPNYDRLRDRDPTIEGALPAALDHVLGLSVL